MVHLYSSSDSDHRVRVERQFTRRNQRLNRQMRKVGRDLSKAVEDVENSKVLANSLLDEYYQVFSMMILALQTMRPTPWTNTSLKSIISIGMRLQYILEHVSEASDSLDKFTTTLNNFNESIARDPRFRQ